MVKGNLNKPKTKSGVRKVLFLPEAKGAFQNLRKITSEYKFVFVNNNKEAYQSLDAILKHWVKALNKTKIKYRTLYQMRHTYASIMISNGENLFWLATQMSHRDAEMIIKNMLSGYHKKII